MTDYQAQAVCPQCGSAAAVHSIQELASLVQGRLGGLLSGFGGQAPPGQVPGWAQDPQPGPPPGPQGPPPGWHNSAPQGPTAQWPPAAPAGPAPGEAAASPPGWVGEPQAGPPQGEAAAPPSGWVGEPQAGPPPGPAPGWVGEPQSGPPSGPGPGQVGEPQAGPPPGPVSGWVGEPQAGPPPGSAPGGWARRPQSGPVGPGGILGRAWQTGAESLEDEIGGAALGVAARFISRKIGKRVQQSYTERIQPAMAARGEAMLREQLEIAERHPNLRACMTDKVVFLAGGHRTVPLSSIKTGRLTMEQADALVAQLSEG